MMEPTYVQRTTELQWSKDFTLCRAKEDTGGRWHLNSMGKITRKTLSSQETLQEEGLS